MQLFDFFEKPGLAIRGLVKKLNAFCVVLQHPLRKYLQRVSKGLGLQAAGHDEKTGKKPEKEKGFRVKKFRLLFFPAAADSSFIFRDFQSEPFSGFRLPLLPGPRSP
jgi:hypothetical protein